MNLLGSLRRKLFLSYALLVLGVVGGSGWSLYHFAVLGRSVRLIMSNNYRSVLDAENMKETLERQDSAMTFHIAGNDPKAVPQYRANRELFARDYADAADNITEKGEAEAIRDIGDQFDSYTRKAHRFLGPGLSNADLRRLYFAEMEPSFLRLKDRCDDLLQLNQNAMVAGRQRAERQAAAASRATIVLAIVLLLLGILYSERLSRMLVAPLRTLAHAAERIGEGDLDLQISVETGDEVELLAEEFNRMASRLKAYRDREASRLFVAEEKSAAVIDSLYEPVVVTGPVGEVLSLNRAGETLFGPESGWLNAPVDDLKVPCLAETVREAIAHRAAMAPEGDRGMAVIGQPHAERFYRVRTAPLLQKSGDVAGTVTVLEDVTRLRELDRLKDEFISVASHELRTPLTSLQMSVQLLAEESAGPLSERQARLVRIADQDCARLDRLTRDLLDLTRLEAGTAAFHRQRLAAHAIIEKALLPLRPAAEQKGITLRLSWSEDLAAVGGDEEQLIRVASNLLSNAIRHTCRGGKIEVGAIRDGEFVRFSVRDTGEGIAPEYLGRIFDRFVQVPGATSGGAASGLSISRKIIEAHGGTIGVTSVQGPDREHGTEFTFTVPVDRTAGEAHA